MLNRCEKMPLPACPACQSTNTAKVSTGIAGRSLALAAATTRVKLEPNPFGDGDFFCNDCDSYFCAEGKALAAPVVR
jgi:hypothetical protein